MQKFISAVDALSKWSGKITAFLVIPMILIIVYTALMRYVFHHAVDWGFEASLFIYGMHFMLSGAYCLNVKSHVIVDILPSRLPYLGQKLAAAFGSIFVFFVAVMLVWMGSKWAWKSTLILEHSSHQTAFDPQIWWYKWMIPISAFMLGLQALSDIMVSLRDAFSKPRGN